MKPKIYIDGKEGTTGLQIYDRLGGRDDIELLLIDDDKRKDTAERKKLINSADIVFLCLPDDAAREAVAMAKPTTRIIDASTAHRTLPGWAYGFAELSPAHRANIASGTRVAVPGCYASGFIALVYPLIQAGVLEKDYPLVCLAMSGYSGGGRRMIEQYQAEARADELESPRLYALTQEHKHLPEMAYVCGLDRPPVFCPSVADYYAGMTVTVPLRAECLKKPITRSAIREIYAKHFAGQSLVQVLEDAPEGFLGSHFLANRDIMQLGVAGNDERILLTACLDNLGKGASGAAVQCMNLMLSLPETTGLQL